MRRACALIIGLACSTLGTGCFLGRSECVAACGEGRACQKLTMSSDSQPVFACFQSCQRDTQCPEGQQCNCDEDACSVHTAHVMLNICVGAPKKEVHPFNERFDDQKGEQRQCMTCTDAQVCVNNGTPGVPVYACVPRCDADASCPAPRKCNCTMEPGGYCNDGAPTNICLQPPPPPRCSGDQECDSSERCNCSQKKGVGYCDEAFPSNTCVLTPNFAVPAAR
jgi:hypothetical protein